MKVEIRAKASDQAYNPHRLEGNVDEREYYNQDRERDESGERRHKKHKKEKKEKKEKKDKHR